VLVLNIESPSTFSPKGFRLQTGSPSKLKDRTFQANFRLPHLRKKGKVVKTPLSRRYRNPIILAEDCEKALVDRHYASAAALAWQLRVSRVTQVLRLLRLTSEARRLIAAFSDPLSMPIVTERSLRPIINLPPSEQLQQIQAIIAEGCQASISRLENAGGVIGSWRA